MDLVIVNGVIAWRGAQPVTTGFPGRSSANQPAAAVGRPR